jgi:hypothetical protein
VKRTTVRRRDLTRIAVAIIITAGLLYVAFHRDQPGHGHPNAAGSQAPVVVPSAPAGVAAQPVVQAAPPITTADLVWRDYSGVALPSSRADGPYKTAAELASGFSRTPRGALLAAVNISMRANTLWGPRVFIPTITSQVVGPDRQALLEGCRLYYEASTREAGATDGRRLGRAYVVVEAYRWQSYTPQSASLDLVTAGPGDGGVTMRAATRVQVAWLGGDWRVVAPPGGSWAASATPVRSLARFARFAGHG